MEYRTLEDRRDQEFEVVTRHARQEIFVRDDFALFGHLDGSAQHTVGLGEHRVVGRTAASTDAPASTVEQRQAYAVARRDIAQLAFGLVDRPLAGGDAPVLIRVRVAEHDLVNVASRAHERAIRRHTQQRVEDLTGTLELFERFEQWDEVDARAGPDRVDEPAFAREQDGRQNVVGATGHRDDVALADTVTEPVEQIADDLEGLHGGSLRVVEDDRVQ